MTSYCLAASTVHWWSNGTPDGSGHGTTSRASGWTAVSATGKIYKHSRRRLGGGVYMLILNPDLNEHGHRERYFGFTEIR